MEKSAKNIYREKKTTNIYGSSMPTNNIVPFLFPAKCHSFPSKLHLFPLQEIEHMVDTVLEMLPCMDWKAFQHAPKEKLLIIFFFFPIYFGERERVRDHGGLPTMPTETRLSDGNFICCSWALLFLN